MRSFRARSARTLSGYRRAIIASSLLMGICTTVTLGAALTSDASDRVVDEAIAEASVDVTSDTRAADGPVQTTEDIEHNIHWFNGRPVRPAAVLKMRVTAYSPDAQSCGEFADGYTASGYSVRTNGGQLVAADSRVLPLGSMITVPGYDASNIVPVLDRGGAIKGNRLDVLFPTHEAALEWGVRDLDVTVWEYADGKPNDFKRGSYGN